MGKDVKDKIKILLVEDEEVTRKTFKLILEEDGYEVVAFELGYEAVDEAKQNFYNVAIIDLTLLDMDGLEVLQRIKKAIPDICGIIMTAYPSIKTTIEAVEAEAYDYIVKPYNIDEVLYIIRRAVEKRELRRSIERMKKAALVGYLGEAMCHEMFNPLSVASSAIHFLMSRIKNGKKPTLKEYKKFFKDITKHIERCVEIATIFRKFYASIGIELKPKNLEKTLREVLEGKI